MNSGSVSSIPALWLRFHFYEAELDEELEEELDESLDPEEDDDDESLAVFSSITCFDNRCQSDRSST